MFDFKEIFRINKYCNMQIRLKKLVRDPNIKLQVFLIIIVYYKIENQYKAKNK